MKDRLKKIRVDAGCTQQEFASRLDLSRSFIIQIEKGDRQVSDRTIKDICRVFGVNEIWLRTGEGNPKEQTLPLDDFQVTMEIIEREMGKSIPDLIKAMAKMYAEADPVDRETMDRLLEELLNNMK